jgi:excisionase family DNA binding protein
MHATPEQVEQILSKPTATAEEVAMIFGLGRGQAYKSIREGEIRSIRMGRRVMVPTAAIREKLDGVPAA